MYLNTFGGSGLLHILAAHPRVVAVLGIVGTVSMLVSPNGPGAYRGTARYAQALDASISELGTAAVMHDATLATDRLLTASPEAVSGIVAETLQVCGPQCDDVTTAQILSDPGLLRKVVLLNQVNQRVMARNRAAAAAVTAGK